MTPVSVRWPALAPLQGPDAWRCEDPRAVVAEFEKPAGEPSGWGWRCRKCGETVEAQFTECWQCVPSRP